MSPVSMEEDFSTVGGVPKEIETMMSAFILLIVVVFYEIIRRYIVTQQVKDASKKVDDSS